MPYSSAAILAAALALAACAETPGGGMTPAQQAEFGDLMAAPDPLSNSEIPAADENDPN